MAPLRFVHTADWQLGMTRHFLDADAQPRYTAARTDAVRRTGQLARERDAEFVLVCGDVFESNAVGPRVVARALEALADGGVPVYLLPGNHDPLDASSVLRSPEVRSAPGVHVLDTPGPHEVRPGVELVAAPWTSKRPLSDLVAQAVAGLPADGTLRVVAGHGAVDALSPDRDDPARIALAPLEEALADGRLHYVALGDRHSTTRVGPSGAVWYAGSPEVTDRREVDPGNVLVVELDSSSPAKVEPVRVGTWAFPLVRAELDSDESLAALRERLTAMPAKDRTVVTLSLTGTLTLAQKAELDDLLEAQRHLFAGVQEWERHTDLVVLPADAELSDLGLGGWADGAVAELAELAGRADHGGSGGVGGPDPVVARDALALLHRLAGGGPRA
ncbi:metallophosphoesterase family protein [Kineococcus sp. SYSU DK004]|uniref:metallophosphoesterase family protein n=1 Tax=Kineococcus sp. SYSU DK004 TaxID=3383125 RepID=UPI003D7C7BFC